MYVWLRARAAYMTLGIDVSALFRDMIMATNTRDLVQKKLVYQYLCHYATSNQEMSLLAVNTLLKDCRDSSPMVRGLALRSLCSLRLPSLVEYLLPQIQAGLLDTQAYVRKTAVMGCLKLYCISPKTIRGTEIIDKLYDMLRDRDAQVVANVVNCLNEILQDEGGMALNKSIVVHLLNKLNYPNEWAQCAVLELVARYRPPQKEILDYLNLLESRMNHANGAVVFATIVRSACRGVSCSCVSMSTHIHLETESVFEPDARSCVALRQSAESCAHAVAHRH